MTSIRSYLALLPLLAACKPAAPAFVPPPPPEVTVEAPAQREVPRLLTATGNTRAAAAIEVRPRVQGFVEKRHVEGGRRVSAGQLLFTIDARPFELVVNQRRAEVAAAQAQLRLNEATLGRTQKAVANDAAARIQLDRALAERDDAKAKEDLARANLDAAELDLSYTKVVAPGPGRLGVVVVDPGALVDSKSVLATLIDDATIYVTFQLDESQLAELQHTGMQGTEHQGTEHQGTEHQGTEHPQDGRRLWPDSEGNHGLEVKMSLTGEAGQPHRGHIDRRDNTVDPGTGTIALEAIFDNAGGAILPGQFCRVQMTLNAERLWTVPDIAVQRDPEGSYVLVVGDGSKVERRGVEPAGSIDGFRGVRQGLEGKERVVVNGIQRARIGMPVVPQVRSPASTPPSDHR